MRDQFRALLGDDPAPHSVGSASGLVCVQFESPVAAILTALQQAHRYGMATMCRPNPLPNKSDHPDFPPIRRCIGLVDHLVCGTSDLEKIVEKLKSEGCSELDENIKAWEAELKLVFREISEKAHEDWKLHEGLPEAKQENFKKNAIKHYGAALALDVAKAHALLDLGVDNVVLMLLGGKEKDSPTHVFGGCVLVSKRRLRPPPELPETWGQAGGKLMTLPGRDGRDRVLVVELPTPHFEDTSGRLITRELFEEGAADGFVGALAMQVALGLSLEDAMPLAAALCSISSHAPGAVSSYVSGASTSEETADSHEFDRNTRYCKRQRERAAQIGTDSLVERARRLARNQHDNGGAGARAAGQDPKQYAAERRVLELEAELKVEQERASDKLRDAASGKGSAEDADAQMHKAQEANRALKEAREALQNVRQRIEQGASPALENPAHDKTRTRRRRSLLRAAGNFLRHKRSSGASPGGNAAGSAPSGLEGTASMDSLFQDVDGRLRSLDSILKDASASPTAMPVPAPAPLSDEQLKPALPALQGAGKQDAASTVAALRAQLQEQARVQAQAQQQQIELLERLEGVMKGRGSGNGEGNSSSSGGGAPYHELYSDRV